MQGLRHCGQITYSARFMLPYFCDSADSFDFHSCIPASETRLYLSETGNCHSLEKHLCRFNVVCEVWRKEGIVVPFGN